VLRHKVPEHTLSGLIMALPVISTAAKRALKVPPAGVRFGYDALGGEPPRNRIQREIPIRIVSGG